MKNEVLKTMEQRMSIRAFQDKPVSEEVVETIMTAAASGPNMNNFQPVTLIEITDQAVKNEITNRVGMPYIAGAPRFFILTIDYNKLFIGADDASVVMMKENLAWTNMLEGALISAGIAADNFVLAAESLGLGAVTMAGAVVPLDYLQEKLQLPDFVKPVLGLSLGYPDQQPGVKPKLPVKGGVWMKDKYQEDEMAEAVVAYNQTMSTYFAGRGISEDWTTHNIKMLTRGLRDNSAPTEYLHAKGFAKK
jgi:nitroreductase/FMN reductase [NAD(P)H]